MQAYNMRDYQILQNLIENEQYSSDEPQIQTMSPHNKKSRTGNGRSPNIYSNSVVRSQSMKRSNMTSQN
jgi:hypothetical protein